MPLAAAGNDFWSVETALWLSVPGSDELSLVMLDIVCETATSAIVAASHMPITTNRRRTQTCPTPYSAPVTFVLLARTDAPRRTQRAYPPSLTASRAVACI